jgi:hypothetical protein
VPRILLYKKTQVVVPLTRSTRPPSAQSRVEVKRIMIGSPPLVVFCIYEYIGDSINSSGRLRRLMMNSEPSSYMYVRAPSFKISKSNGDGATATDAELGHNESIPLKELTPVITKKPGVPQANLQGRNTTEHEHQRGYRKCCERLFGVTSPREPRFLSNSCNHCHHHW